MTDLVPGRVCGSCNACCHWLHIDNEELRKPAGVLCRHARADQGCDLHPAWPKLCREWFCGWRSFESLSEAWRPDRSGVILIAKDSDIPPGYEMRPGLLMLLVWPFAMVVRPAFVSLLSGLIAQRRPVFISIPGPPGGWAAHFFANALLEEANAAGDVERFGGLLSSAVEELERFEFRPAQFVHDGPDFSS